MRFVSLSVRSAFSSWVSQDWQRVSFSVRGAFQLVGEQRVSIRCAARFTSVHSAFGLGSLRVGSAFRFGEQWVRFRGGGGGGIIVLSSNKLIGRLS